MIVIMALSLSETELYRHLPIGRYEYVDVTFAAANVETIIPHTRLTPPTPDDVRWLDIKPTSVYSGGSHLAPLIYRNGNPTNPMPWGDGYIVLMCNLANYTTRLLLFVERT